MKKNDFDKFWQEMETVLTSAQSTCTVFNQYRDRNDEVDLPDAPMIRLENFRGHMAAAASTASILIVGEAAGPWGCRFSGVPFTGEKQLIDPSFPLHGRRSSKAVSSCPTKMSPPFVSRSSEIFWSVMRPYYGHFWVWDAFPLHSHKQHDVLTVRNPTKHEVSQFREALKLIKAYMKPAKIVAVGKKAFEELEVAGEASMYVRHPSRGGNIQFATGMHHIFEGS